MCGSVRHADAGYFDPCQVFDKCLSFDLKIETFGGRSNVRIQIIQQQAESESGPTKNGRASQRTPGHALIQQRSQCDQPTRPWQCLYFLPEPQGHIALRGVRGSISSADPKAVAGRRTIPSGSGFR